MSDDAEGGIGERLRSFAPEVLADAPPLVIAGYALVATFVVVYVLSVAARDGVPGNVAWDGWTVAIVELLAAGLCLARLLVAKPAVRGRGVVLALGAGMVCWAVGDVIVAARFTSPTPTAAELSYLGFYPLAYVAVVLLMRQEVKKLPAATWLDGALAGLGAAAVCAAFAFKDLVHSNGGSSVTTALNLAYPIGDVLLLALVVGGTAMLPGRRRVRWFLVAVACSINAVGDTFNLLHNSLGASAVGQGINASAWPIAIVLMSVAMWTRASTPVLRDQAPATGFILPGLAAAAGLVILIVGSVHPVGKVTLGLASATLVVAGLRLALSVGALKNMNEQRHRQSITDELTGLGNRRHLSHLFETLVAAAIQEAEETLLQAHASSGFTGGSGDSSVGAQQTAVAAQASSSTTDVSATAPTTAGATTPSAAAASGAVTTTTVTTVTTKGIIAVLFVDLDRFKEVNDAFGHTVGDELLRQIGPRLGGTLRRDDTLIRLGGDEFAVVLPATDEEQAFRVAERLAASLEQPFYLDLVPVQISASIGIAIAPRDGSDLSEILRCADSAMYRAKMAHVQVQIYDRAFDDGGDLLQLAEELREAVQGDGLVLYFQPLLELKTGTISAVEALLRWEHPRLGTIPPLKFLPLAEEAGLMPAITARVVTDALAQCARWREEGQELAVSVNISASNLLEAGFVDFVASALERSGVPAESLVLEITETCIISDYDSSREVIERLRRIGVVMSIDDFGAGFTSLAHLSNLAVGELKLDRSFIAPLSEGHETRDVELVRSTIRLGHALGLRVVAEGIETDEALELLSEFECDIAQGFLISRPMPADRLQIAQLTSTWRQRSPNGGALAVAALGPSETNGSTPA